MAMKSATAAFDWTAWAFVESKWVPDEKLGVVHLAWRNEVVAASKEIRRLLWIKESLVLRVEWG